MSNIEEFQMDSPCNSGIVGSNPFTSTDPILLTVGRDL